MSRTNLIIVSGSPGSGKTTLARKLGDALGFPVIARDAIKEVLMNGMPPASRQESMRLGGASWPMMYGVLDTLIGRVPGVIIESNFRRGISEPELVPRVNRCHAIVLHCTARWGTIESRIQARQGDPNRHQGHFDQVALVDVRRDFEKGQFDPLDLDLSSVVVETTDSYHPMFDDLVEIIERRVDSGN
ncbi:MAG: AAA family ATPase [Thermomicrobiales bacterium]